MIMYNIITKMGIKRVIKNSCKFKLRKIKKIIICAVMLSVCLHFWIMWPDVLEANIENFAQNIVKNKGYEQLFTPKIFSETLFLIKSKSLTYRQVSMLYSEATMCNMNIVSLVKDKNIFERIFSKLINWNQDFELISLTEWINRDSSAGEDSIKYLVYIDLINFSNNVTDIFHSVSKLGCLDCVCFLLHKEQKLVGLSGPKNKAIEFLKQSNLVKNLQNGFSNTKSISSITVLSHGLVKYQNCGYNSKEHLCNGDIEQYKHINTQGTHIHRQIGNISEDEVLHIVYATSMDQIEQMLISIKSILQTTSVKSKLHFHIFYYTNISEKYFEELKHLVTGCRARITFHRFNGIDEVGPLINTQYVRRPELFSPNNYIRFLLHEKLPKAKWCLWLDNDVFVLKDIIPLFEKVCSEGSHKTVASFARNLKITLKIRAYETLKANGVQVSTSKYPRLQAGILFMNLEKWRKDEVFSQVLKISKLNKEFKLYKKLGSQAPLELLFNGDRFYHINSDLGIENLGYVNSSYMFIPCDAIFLHWNGKLKPWLNDKWRRMPQNLLLWNHVLNQTADLKC